MVCVVDTWSVDISSAEKQITMAAIMKPKQARSEESLVEAIESWDRDHCELLRIDSSCGLRYPFRITAFENLLLQSILLHLEQQMDSTLNEDCEGLWNRVYDWALRKRLPASKNRPGAVANVNSEIPVNLPRTANDSQAQCGDESDSYVDCGNGVWADRDNASPEALALAAVGRG